QTIKAALAAGYPLVVAMLLPTDWGWQSGHGAVTSGYHEICAVGYTADGYLLCLNSWGSQWGRNGLGSVLFNYLEANNLQNRYVFSYNTSPVAIPNPTPIPTPTPTPTPDPTPQPVKRTLAAVATGSGVNVLAVGQNLTAGTINLQITQIS